MFPEDGLHYDSESQKTKLLILMTDSDYPGTHVCLHLGKKYLIRGISWIQTRALHNRQLFYFIYT